MVKTLIRKSKVRHVDDLEDNLKDVVDTRTSAESPTPSWVSLSSSDESGFLLSPHVLNEPDTELDTFEIIKPQRSAGGDNIQSSADATEVVFKEPRDPTLKYNVVEEVKKALAPSFDACSTTAAKPGDGRSVRITPGTKDADKPPKNFTRTTSEACSIPSHGVYVGDREGVFVPQQLLNEQQLEKEQRKEAQEEKYVKDLLQSEKENKSLKLRRKARFADDDSLYGVIKTAKDVPTRYGVPKRWAADDESSTWAPRRYSQDASDDESSVLSYGLSVLSAGASEYTSGTGYSTGATSVHSKTCTRSAVFVSADTCGYSTFNDESSVFSEQMGFSASTGYTDSTRQFLDFVDPSDVSVDRSYRTADTSYRSYRTADTSDSEGSVELICQAVKTASSNDLEIQSFGVVQMLVNNMCRY
jgi:hypothetical protein